MHFLAYHERHLRWRELSPLYNKWYMWMLFTNLLIFVATVFKIYSDYSVDVSTYVLLVLSINHCCMFNPMRILTSLRSECTQMWLYCMYTNLFILAYHTHLCAHTRISRTYGHIHIHRNHTLMHIHLHNCMTCTHSTIDMCMYV